MKITKVVKEKVLKEYWEVMDSILKKRNHSKMVVWVDGRFYEIVRRYKARK